MADRIQERFITERKGAWQRLEDLLNLLDGSSLRRLHREEVRELGRIYRRAASDLAIARAESRDPRLVNYLNSLVIRAHGRIYRAGYGHELLTFMSAHGVIELTCIFIAGGAGMLFGTALLFPGDIPRFDNLRLRGREAAQLITGCVPLLAVAGTIEGFISPATIPDSMKFSVAAVTGVALYSYLLLAGRGEGTPHD